MDTYGADLSREIAAVAARFVVEDGMDYAALEARMAAHMAQATLEISHRRQDEGALARAALADDADGLAAPHREVDVAQHRKHVSGAGDEPDLQSADVEDKVAGHAVQ